MVGLTRRRISLLVTVVARIEKDSILTLCPDFWKEKWRLSLRQRIAQRRHGLVPRHVNQ
jgi:hypothetical protein